MRFAIVLSDLSGGGAEKATAKVASILVRRQHEVEVFLLVANVAHSPPEGVKFCAIFPKGQLSHGWLGKRLAARRLSEVMGERERFDVVVSSLPFADEVTDLAGIPRQWCRIANTLSSEVERLGNRHPLKARRRRSRYLNLYSKHPLIAVSEGVADDLKRRLGIQSRIVVIPNPFDFESIRANAALWAETPSIPFAVHVGRFAPQKRHDLLLDTWLRIPQAPVLVLLTEKSAALQEMIDARGLGDRVLVAGFHPNPYPWIQRAKVLVLCSDHEGLPNVLIEAIACGTPVVSTDCPSGPSEILSAFPECLVPCGDPAALAEAIMRTLENPPNLAKFDFSPYLPDRVASAWEALATP